jgi:hypothetical protein
MISLKDLLIPVPTSNIPEGYITIRTDSMPTLLSKVTDPPLIHSCDNQCEICPIMDTAHDLLDVSENVDLLTTFIALETIGVPISTKNICGSFVDWYNSILEQNKLKAILS